ncbi:MAG: hypothetical protein D6761_12965 [Candidatus Dadabacteria bacterium]|nr:MAG: hypothetical protein D6761_12965 [Candidatus Dadabacteria bacterium]
MDFSFDAELDAPADAVFRTLQFDLSELIPLLPNIERVDLVASQENEQGLPYTLHHWFATPGMAPTLIRPFVTANMTQWLDHGTWNAAAGTIDWRFESPTMRDLYDCGGTHHVLERDAGRSTLRFSGTFAINAAAVPGVPTFLVRRVAPALEKFMLNMIVTNLRELPRAIATHLGGPSGAPAKR